MNLDVFWYMYLRYNQFIYLLYPKLRGHRDVVQSIFEKARENLQFEAVFLSAPEICHVFFLGQNKPWPACPTDLGDHHTCAIVGKKSWIF